MFYTASHERVAQDPPPFSTEPSLVNSPSYNAHRASGPGGAVATAHPLATDAAVVVLDQGGSATDAAIAAQAVICVVMPQAAGIGGDVLALVHDGARVSAVNGTGRSAWAAGMQPLSTGGASVTVPGLVDGWLTLHARWGRLPLPQVLTAAVGLAVHGVRVEQDLVGAVDQQRARLRQGGASDWPLMSLAEHDLWRPPQLAELLAQVAEQGRDAFYAGPSATAVVDAVHRTGGLLDPADLAEHSTPCPDPVTTPWGGGQAHVQPPMSQGVLLAMALQKVHHLHSLGVWVDDHVLVEVTQSAFAHRSSCVSGSELLREELPVDLERASGRRGPRAYLHTAGVATVDATGQVVSSLVSVFDDFGSGVFVPELGIVLNNRAAGFTDGDNVAAPGRRPVHTLAPALLTSPEGVLAIATPGADGQVQTLLQVLAATSLTGASLSEAIGTLRWRSQDGELLVEAGHLAHHDLASRGHRVRTVEPGADLFGAVVAAGTNPSPFAVADWRRRTNSRGVA